MADSFESKNWVRVIGYVVSAFAAGQVAFIIMTQGAGRDRLFVEIRGYRGRAKGA